MENLCQDNFYEIFKYCDWKTLLVLERVSKAFQTLSRRSEFWETATKEFQLFHGGGERFQNAKILRRELKFLRESSTDITGVEFVSLAPITRDKFVGKCRELYFAVLERRNRDKMLKRSNSKCIKCLCSENVVMLLQERLCEQPYKGVLWCICGDDDDTNCCRNAMCCGDGFDAPCVECRESLAYLSMCEFKKSCRSCLNFTNDFTTSIDLCVCRCISEECTFCSCVIPYSSRVLQSRCDRDSYCCAFFEVIINYLRSLICNCEGLVDCRYGGLKTCCEDYTEWITGPSWTQKTSLRAALSAPSIVALLVLFPSILAFFVCTLLGRVLASPIADRFTLFSFIPAITSFLSIWVALVFWLVQIYLDVVIFSISFVGLAFFTNILFLILHLAQYLILASVFIAWDAATPFVALPFFIAYNTSLSILAWVYSLYFDDSEQSDSTLSCLSSYLELIIAVNFVALDAVLIVHTVLRSLTYGVATQWYWIVISAVVCCVNLCVFAWFHFFKQVAVFNMKYW